MWYRCRLLVLGKTVAEALACGCEFAELVPDHFFRDGHRKMKLAIMHQEFESHKVGQNGACLLYTSPSPRDVEESRMPSSA